MHPQYILQSNHINPCIWDFTRHGVAILHSFPVESRDFNNAGHISDCGSTQKNGTRDDKDLCLQTSEAERIGVNQVAKVLPSGKASGVEQRKLSHLGACTCFAQHPVLADFQTFLLGLQDSPAWIARHSSPCSKNLVRLHAAQQRAYCT